MAFDGTAWNENTPDNSNQAHELDDYNRDDKKATRSRLALEHIWPASQTSTAEGGPHIFVTFSAQGTAPGLVYATNTQVGAIYIDTNNALIHEKSDGTLITIVGATSTQIALGAVVDRVVRADISSPGTQAIACGFLPAVIEFRSVADSQKAMSWGYDNGTSAHATFITSNDGLGHFDTANSIVIDQSAGNKATAKVTAINATGAVITWSTAGTPSGSAMVQFIARG